MLAFVIFTITMSITPGPNTIMAMASGQTIGFKKSLNLNWGMATGMFVTGAFAAIFSSWLQNTPLVIEIMKLIGCLYLLYLAYHTAISVPDDTNNGSSTFNTGFLLQLSNIKLYLYFITGLGAFSLSGLLNQIPLRLLLMVAIGSAGTFLWTVGGQLINKFYHQHFRIINVLVACLLIFSAADLWH
ncbi:LysE family transporter [Lentilactobacillus sp. SPB1-3]|uniref:LysE family transporter n=1 Tax=Lentilactobacillus terminaliae TaxID=3003483 RepID=A0ACD5DHP2_9LACO|nr:LysE family transporter [Lentilactobacillus sp. SPB1-3]MCZ0977047.1 LysE family transporter [Lentilactobacillus sp. SPB1-3]